MFIVLFSLNFHSSLSLSVFQYHYHFIYLKYILIETPRKTKLCLRLLSFIFACSLPLSFYLSIIILLHPSYSHTTLSIYLNHTKVYMIIIHWHCLSSLASPSPSTCISLPLSLSLFRTININFHKAILLAHSYTFPSLSLLVTLYLSSCMCVFSLSGSLSVFLSVPLSLSFSILYFKLCNWAHGVSTSWWSLSSL